MTERSHLAMAASLRYDAQTHIGSDPERALKELDEANREISLDFRENGPTFNGERVYSLTPLPKVTKLPNPFPTV